MRGSLVRSRKISRVQVAWAVVLFILSGCAPVGSTVEPPQALEEMSAVVLKTAPATIALTRADLPAGFQLAAEKSTGFEYTALYLRPSALDPNAAGGNTLLSVLTIVGVYTTTAAAEKVYGQTSADPARQAIENTALAGGRATDIVTESFAGAVQGANAAEAYRVTYRLMGQPIFEYGHRFRLGNALGYVVVAAMGNPDEPQRLRADTRDLVQRQIDHIIDAAVQPAPK